MKHLLTALSLLLLTAAEAQKKAPQTNDSLPPAPVVYTISGDAQTMQFLLYVLDNPAKVTHLQATQLRDWISEQLQRQTQPKQGPK